jgi:hypothetical protein
VKEPTKKASEEIKEENASFSELNESNTELKSKDGPQSVE